jgi:hypothetical protein
MKVGPTTVSEICLVIIAVFVVIAYFSGWG